MSHKYIFLFRDIPQASWLCDFSLLTLSNRTAARAPNRCHSIKKEVLINYMFIGLKSLWTKAVKSIKDFVAPSSQIDARFDRHFERCSTNSDRYGIRELERALTSSVTLPSDPTTTRVTDPAVSACARTWHLDPIVTSISRSLSRSTSAARSFKPISG